MKMHYIFTGF